MVSVSPGLGHLLFVFENQCSHYCHGNFDSVFSSEAASLIVCLVHRDGRATWRPTYPEGSTWAGAQSSVSDGQQVTPDEEEEEEEREEDDAKAVSRRNVGMFPALRLSREGPEVWSWWSPGLLPGQMEVWGGAELLLLLLRRTGRRNRPGSVYIYLYLWNAHSVRSDMWTCLHACEFDHTVRTFFSLPKSCRAYVCMCMKTQHTHTHEYTYTHFKSSPSSSFYIQVLKENMCNASWDTVVPPPEASRVQDSSTTLSEEQRTLPRSFH